LKRGDEHIRSDGSTRVGDRRRIWNWAGDRRILSEVRRGELCGRDLDKPDRRLTRSVSLSFINQAEASLKEVLTYEREEIGTLLSTESVTPLISANPDYLGVQYCGSPDLGGIGVVARFGVDDHT